MNKGIKSSDSSQQVESPASVTQQQKKAVESLPSEYRNVDVDLTKLNSTMVYSEVYNMIDSPDDYPEIGDTITVVGIFDTYYEEDNRYCRLVDAYIS